MRNLFNPDNVWFRYMEILANLMILNVLCLLCALPIITIGPMLAALYSVTLKMAIDEETGIFSTFFCALRSNWKQGLILGILFTGFAAFWFFDLLYSYTLIQQGASIPRSILLGLLFAGCFILMMGIYLFSLIAKFKNTLRGHFRTALQLIFRHLGKSLLMLVIALVPFLLLLYSPKGFAISGIFYLLCGIPAVAYFQSRILNKIFIQYIHLSSEQK